jgi:hypothetical protein
MSSVQRMARALHESLAFVRGAGGAAPIALAPDVRSWVASPEQGLIAGIESVRGARETAGALGRLAPSSVTVVAAVVSNEACWAEVTRAANGASETCLAGLTYDGAGAVSRLVLLRAPFVTPSEAADGSAAPDGRPILEQYFDELQGSRFTEAAAHFTLDTIYSHPPYGGGNERVRYVGREALLRGFVTDRGPSPVRQVITAFWQRSGRVFVEGIIDGIPNGGTFFSTGELTANGEIARYVAFYSAQRIPA